MAEISESIVPPGRRWLQFSLRSILMMIVIAAVGFSIWVSNQRMQENRRLQAEIKRLKSELGELTIEDGQEHKLHAIGIPSVESLMWKWRVYVPTGKSFYLQSRMGNIPPGGKLGDGASTSSSGTLEEGEQVVTVALRRNHRDEWNWVVKRSDGNSRSGVSREVQEMVDAGNYGTSFSSLGAQQKVLEPASALKLLSLTMHPNQKSTAKAKPTGSGIEVWISDDPPK